MNCCYLIAHMMQQTGRLSLEYRADDLVPGDFVADDKGMFRRIPELWQWPLTLKINI
jgi:hypothetical protein